MKGYLQRWGQEEKGPHKGGATLRTHSSGELKQERRGGWNRGNPKNPEAGEGSPAGAVG